MRLTRARADGFLSYDGFDLPLTERITMIVGPNGHGKSNLGHVLRLVRTAIALADRATPEIDATLNTYLAARRQRPHVGGGLRAQLDIEFTGDEEQDLIDNYVRAAITQQLLGTTSGYDTGPIDAWVTENVRSEHLTPLHRGSLVVGHAGHADSSWQVAFAFDHTDDDAAVSRYRWLLHGWPGRGEIMWDIDADSATGARTRQSVADSILGRVRRDGPPEVPDRGFTFDYMRPEPGGAVQCSLDLGMSTSPHIRRFTDAIGVEVRGLGDNVRHYTFARVLRHVLDHALLSSADDRLATPNSTRLLNLDPRSIGTTERMATRLFMLKNGPAGRRAALDRITHRFAALANGRQVDVAAAPGVAGTREVEAGRARAASTFVMSGEDASDGGSLEVTLQLLVSARPVMAGDRGDIAQVPIDFAGAGAGEALLLAFTLDADAGGVVFLDEPAATLHPTTQRRFATFLGDGDAQFIVTTHSPALVPYGIVDRLELCRFELDDEMRTRPWRVDPDLLRRVSAKVVAKGNQGLPFAAAVVLCEGQSDVAFCRGLARRLALQIEEANILIVDCGSRDNMPDYIAFAAELGLRHLAVMDADTAKAAADDSVRRKADAVREATAMSPLGQLVEFPENLEQSVAVVKHKNLDYAAIASEVAIDGTPELQRLAVSLQQLVAGAVETAALALG